MKKLGYLTAALLLLLTLSCGGGGGNDNDDPIIPPPDDPVIPPPDDKTAEWTVMLYMGADNNLALYSLFDLNELEQVGSTDDVQFTALADVYDVYNVFNETYLVSLFDDAGNPVTPMMRVTKNPEDGVQSHLVDTQAVLYDNIGFNSADPDNLTEFIKWSAQRFPAKRYAIFIWNHGSSWLPGRTGSAAVGDDNEGGGNSMFIHEIESAIRKSGIHFDLLTFEACNMASVEVAYQLKDVTDYICASQKVMLVGNDGNFEAYASFLTGNPTSSPAAFGRVIVDSYVDIRTAADDASTTRSLIRTDRLNNVAQAVSDLTPLLANPAVISSDDLQSTFYEPIRFFRDVDLCNYTYVLPYHVQNPQLNTALNNVRSACEAAVVHSRVFTSTAEEPVWNFGNREFGRGEDLNVTGAAGLNIFLPTERDWNDTNFSYYTSIAFTRDTGWHWVIAHAYDGVPYLGMAPGYWNATVKWSTGVDLDFWLFEPDGYGNLIPSSPALGPNASNGTMSGDSYNTWISAEAFQAYPEVVLGPYFFLAVYYMPNFCSNDAYCLLEIGAYPRDPDPLTSDVYYISETLPDDPDFGEGVVYFGFALYNPDDGYWYFFEGLRGGESYQPERILRISNELELIQPAVREVDLSEIPGLDARILEQYVMQGIELSDELAENRVLSK